MAEREWLEINTTLSYPFVDLEDETEGSPERELCTVIADASIVDYPCGNVVPIDSYGKLVPIPATMFELVELDLSAIDSSTPDGMAITAHIKLNYYYKAEDGTEVRWLCNDLTSANFYRLSDRWGYVQWSWTARIGDTGPDGLPLQYDRYQRIRIAVDMETIESTTWPYTGGLLFVNNVKKYLPGLVTRFRAAPMPEGSSSSGSEEEIPIGEYESISGDVAFYNGFNFEFIAEDSSQFFGASEEANRLRADASAGLGEGQFYYCESIDDRILTINEVAPDEHGNINLDFSTCLRATQPATYMEPWTPPESSSPGSPDIYDFQYLITAMPATLKLNSDCSACCQCEYWVRLYKALRKWWEEYVYAYRLYHHALVQYNQAVELWTNAKPEHAITTEPGVVSFKVQGSHSGTYNATFIAMVSPEGEEPLRGPISVKFWVHGDAIRDIKEYPRATARVGADWTNVTPTFNIIDSSTVEITVTYDNDVPAGLTLVLQANCALYTHGGIVGNGELIGTLTYPGGTLTTDAQTFHLASDYYGVP